MLDVQNVRRLLLSKHTLNGAAPHLHPFQFLFFLLFFISKKKKKEMEMLILKRVFIFLSHKLVQNLYINFYKSCLDIFLSNFFFFWVENLTFQQAKTSRCMNYI